MENVSVILNDHNFTEQSFFKYGKVLVKTADPVDRMAVFHVTVPCNTMQASIPILLGSGYIDNFKLMNPIGCWIPTVTKEHIKPNVIQAKPDIDKNIESILNELVLNGLNTFIQLSDAFIDPTHIIPILPLGVYIEFRYRANIDKIVTDVLPKLKQIPVVGIAEFGFALAGSTAEVLKNFGFVLNENVDSL